MVRTVLTAKSSYSDADVQHVWDHIDEYVSVAEADRWVAEACSEVTEVCGKATDEVAYGWSGGKDSLALQVVMDRVGIQRSVCGIVGHLEVPDHLRWLQRNTPRGCEILSNNDLDLRWLAERGRRYLFPATSKDGYFWTLKGTRSAQQRYQRTRNPKMQIYGRRTSDNNYVSSGPYGIFEAGGIVQYAPIRSWPHEVVLAVIRYFWVDRLGDSLPPVYGYPEGWSTGTGPWPGRRVQGGGDERAGWRNTYECDATVVRRAAAYFTEARRVVEEKEG